MFQNSNLIDFNKILKITNVIVLIFLWHSYFNNPQSEYVNLRTVLLASALSFQIAFFLLFEARKRDPFVLLLCLQMTVYFLFRVVTLINYEFSYVFLRYPFSAKELNYALFFILIANTVFYIGLTINSLRFNKINSILDIKPVKPYLLIVVILIGYFFSFYQKLGLASLEILFGMILSLFINLGTILFMVIVFLLLFKAKINNKVRIISIIAIALMVILQTLTGSRSAILGLINYLIFALLAIHDHVKVKTKYLILGSFLLPIMLGIFAITTFLRPRLENRAVIGSETFSVLKEFDFQGTVSEGSNLVLAGVFDRIGFLDYCAETISNADQYSQIFNPVYYFKSIVDNILTPGFTVFDTPRVSNATTFVYNNIGVPSLSKVNEAYQSDEFTLYGEFYALFGKWFSLIPIFFLGFFFKSIYLNLNQNNIYQFYLKRALILFVFYGTLNSFGLDWILLDVVAIFFTYQIFKRFFKFKEIT